MAKQEMIPQIIINLLKNKKIMAGFIIGLLFILGFVYHVSQIAVYKSQVKDLQAKNQELLARIDEQNLKIEYWKAQGDIQKAKVEKAKKELNDISIKYKKLKGQIKDMQPPKSCQGAMEWLKNIAPALSK